MKVSPVHLPVRLLSTAAVTVGLVCVMHAQSTLDASPVTPPSDCYLGQDVVPYPSLREADVMWERRVWRVVDLGHPRNSAWWAPTGHADGCYSLFAIIRNALLLEGAITAYDAGPAGKDDAFQRPLGNEAIVGLLAGADGVQEAEVTRYAIKEDWIFDKQRGVMDVRIIGLAPMRELRGGDGELRGHAPLFWLYFPERRPLFARWLAYRDVDGTDHSFEELFATRRFQGTIVKVGNAMDRTTDEYKIGLDALLEAEGVREQLFKLHFDLWNY
jgi:gliding motility associated protien GldN